MEAVTNSAFGTLLRRYRRDRGLTQEELAELAAISRRSLGDMERGVVHTPRKDTVTLLAAALGLAPEDRQALAEAARRVNTPRLRHAATGPSPALPLALTALIGREHDEAAVLRLIQQHDVRLLTLVGPPGVGKTRLAIQVAASLQDLCSDGIVFVALAALREPQLVLRAIAQSLGVHDAGTRPLLYSLQDHLREKNMLLLLDNFEQVVAAAPLVVDLAVTCPGLTVLVTSRAALHVRGEHEFAVSPLALPAPGTPLDVLNDPAAVRQFAAVALFIARAQAVKHDFHLSVDTAAVVVEICRRLDGLPLAIELAAARSKLLPPPAMLELLVQAASATSLLQVLTGGPQDLPERQQTLRSAIAWSYDLLTTEEQVLWARLSVFMGGWTLQAAEVVCGSVSNRAVNVIEGLAGLMRKSLVQAEGPCTTHDMAHAVDGAGPRFSLLETIREYGLDRLAASGEGEALQRQHAAYFLALAENMESAIWGPHHVAWLARLEVEHANLRAALAWCLAAEDGGTTSIRLVGALHHFWELHGHYTEGRQWIARALARSPGASPAARAKALCGAGRLASSQGDNALGRAFLEESLVLAQDAGDRQSITNVLTNLGNALYREGDYTRARDLYEQSLASARETGDQRCLAASLAYLGLIASVQGDDAQALTRHEEGLAVSTAAGDSYWSNLELLFLGSLAVKRGDLPRADALLRESLDLFVEMGERRQIALEPVMHFGP